jgi:hypothetical protein
MHCMNDRLAKAMRRLAEDTAKVQPASQRELALLAEFDRWNRRRHHRRVWLSVAGLAAAALSTILLIVERPARPPVTGGVEATNKVEDPFVPIPYVTPLAPYERADVVRVNLPVTALVAAGVPVSTAAPSLTMQADVIVGQDGRAHAIRLVSTAGVN